jgi:Cu-processing system ATP-binding protein
MTPNRTDAPAIAVRDATKTYGEVTALDGVSLTVERDETLGVVGTNGAGKSTLFRLLVGHERPDAGTVRVAGRAPSDGVRVRERVGYLPENASFHPALTGREVLRFHARQRGVDAVDRRVDQVLATVGLADAADRRVGGYSNGMNRRLGLGTALVGSPPVLLLDEPTAGLDPEGVAAFDDVLSRIRDETPVTIVVTSHVLDEVASLCDRVAVFDDGRLATTGSVAALTRATADSVTVRLHLGDATPADAAALQDVVPSATVETRRPDAVAFTVAREGAFDLVSAARERLDLAAFEVEEPGLDAVFHDAVDARGGEEA